MKRFLYFILFSIILLSAIVYGLITFTGVSTPSGSTTNTSAIVEYNFSSDSNGITSVKWNWNGTNYSIFNDSLVLFMNFDNRSSLGESSTNVVDLSLSNRTSSMVNLTLTTGKYGNAYSFDRLSHSRVSFADSDLEHIYNGTYIAWIKADGTSASSYRRIYDADSRNFLTLDAGNNAVTGRYYNGSGWVTCTSTKILTSGVWYHLAYTFNKTATGIYIDGELNNSCIRYNDIAYTTGRTSNIGTDYLFGDTFNGIIDDFMIFNRSLSASEINQIYRMSLTKYTSTDWSFYTNQTNLTWGESYNYQLCVSNSSSDETCSSEKTITLEYTKVNVTVNFSNTIGTINNEFYGVQHGDRFSEYDNVSNDMDCTKESVSNYTRERSDYSSAGFKVMRMDMLLPWYVPYTTLDTTLTGDGRKNHASDIKWAYENGNKVLLIASRVPAGLANTTIPDAPCMGVDYGITCPPKNYTQWCYLLQNYINNVTVNGLYLSAIAGIDVWNEPELNTNFLYNLSHSQANQSIRSKYYNEIYNQTYNCIKANYPNLSVGGPATSAIDVAQGQIVLNGFLSNFSNQMDFVSFHEYTYTADSLDEILTRVDYVNTQCSTYGANCSKMYLGEWNMKYNFYTTTHQYYVGLTLLNLLNNYADNITQMLWKFDVGYLNSSCDSSYNYSMYSQFAPTYQYPYNVTKDYATYCPAGGTVVNSTGNDNDIKQVGCIDGGDYNLIVINSGGEAKNVTLTLTGYPYSTISNLKTNENYTVTSGTANIGYVSSNEIVYLGEGTPSITFVEPTDINETIDRTWSYFNITTDEEVDNCSLYFGNGSADWCYQESANVSTSCGGLSTGSYSFTAGWNNQGNTIDTNFSTLGDGDDAYMYANYSIPSRMIPLYWQVKTSNVATTNYSIPALCKSQSPLQFRIESDIVFTTNYQSIGDCWNGTSWTNIFDTSIEENSAGNDIYEEGVFFEYQPNVMNQVTTTSFYYNKTNLTTGNYTYYVSCNDTFGNIGTSSLNWVNVEADTCTAPCTSQWNINLADNCVISTAQNACDYPVNVYGTCGSLTLTSTGAIINAKNFTFNPGCFYLTQGMNITLTKN